MIRGRVLNLWQNIRSSLWFIPGILVLLAMALSSIVLRIDVMLESRSSPVVPWLFNGSANAAGQILSVLAGSLITVVSVAISLTVVALVQAAAQFTPRLLRQFTASRTIQLVLGSYTATFIYSLLILRAVRFSEEGPPFVPALGVTIAIVLALICLALLIYFIHHMAESLQVAVILDHIRSDLVSALESAFPLDGTAFGGKLHPLSTPQAQFTLDRQSHVIRSTEAGFIRQINEDELIAAHWGRGTWVWIKPEIGDYVAYGSILVVLESEAGPELIAAVQNAFVIDRERTLYQDPRFAVRQMVDIALKALSAAINDPTTAEYALYHLGDAMGRLIDRPMPAHGELKSSGGTQILINRPTWDEFIELAFSQIRHTAVGNVHVTTTLLQVLHDLALRLSEGERAPALQQQVAGVCATLDRYASIDAAALGALADSVTRALRHETNASDVIEVSL